MPSTMVSANTFDPSGVGCTPSGPINPGSASTRAAQSATRTSSAFASTSALTAAADRTFSPATVITTSRESPTASLTRSSSPWS